MVTQQTGILTWMRLARTYHKVQRVEMRALAKHGLTIAQFDVLARLSLHEGITQQALADELLVTKGNVCGLINRMVALGLVERRDDPDDKRVNHLYLTLSGATLAQQVIPAHDMLLQSLMDGLTPDAQHQLLGLLRQLDHSIES